MEVTSNADDQIFWFHFLVEPDKTPCKLLNISG